MLADERARADLSIRATFRGGPQDDRICPMLRNRESKLAISDGWLENNQRLTFGRMNLLQGDVERFIVHHGIVRSHAGKAKVFERGETLLIYDLVPLLIEAGPLTPKHYDADVARSILTGRFLHTRKLQKDPTKV